MFNFKKKLTAISNRKISVQKQFLIGISSIAIVAVSSFFLIEIIGYRVVALMLLLAVSILAMLFDILPVLFTAFLSALVWNYFFIPPIYNFHVGTTEDVLLFLMYFVVAMINAVLTFKIRQFERKNRDNESKENTIKLYNTLLNSLSHELRTPISTIIGAIDTIQDKSTKLTESNIRELYSEIEIAAFRLNSQVDNILNMSRLEAGHLKPRLDWIDLNELVFTVIKNNNKEASEHIVLFEPDENLPIFKVDGGIIEQILHNILHNAIQHTPSGTTIKIRVENGVEKFTIIIKDNGSGFPGNEKSLVFEKFYRLSNAKPGGTGLGLSIAKGYTQALKGKIHLEDNIEGGAIFIIEIPAESSSVNLMKNE